MCQVGQCLLTDTGICESTERPVLDRFGAANQLLLLYIYAPTCDQMKDDFLLGIMTCEG
jgi:hypothetical protein